MSNMPISLIEIAVEPKTRADREKLGLALSTLAATDPGFRSSVDRESGQIIVSGIDRKSTRLNSSH